MTLLLIPVETEEDERAVCDTLEAFPSARPRAVPVLNRDGLVQRLQAILRDNGVHFELGSTAAISSAVSIGVIEDAPGVIAVSPGVDERVVQLARVATGAPSLCLPCTEEELKAALVGRRQSVLWLFHPDRTPPDVALEFARQAEAHDLLWGVVFAVEPVAARFALLKSALITRAPSRGAFHFTSSVYAIPGAQDNNLTQIQGDPKAEGGIGTRFEAPHDVLLMAGHANMLDAWIGREAVYCAREGYKGTGEDLASCFNGGRCYRQPHDGPEHELVGVGRSNARVVVLSGCNVLPLGRGWCRTEATLAYQTGGTGTLAFMAPSVVSMGSFELDLLCLCLILEGRPLGEVVREVNRVRRDVLEQPTGLPPGLGPFILMGNPELRLSGASLPSPTFIESAPHGEEGYVLGLPSSRTGAPALLRVPTRPRDAIPYPTLQEIPEDVDLRGAWHCGESEPVLYLYAAGVPPGDTPQTARIEIRDSDSSAALRQTINAWWSTLSFWSMFLSGAEQELLRARQSSKELNALRDELPRLTGALSNYFGWLQTSRGILTVDRAAAGEQDVMWGTMEAWCRRTMEALVDLTQATGRISSCGNPPFLHPMRPIFESEPCPCGGQMFGQVFLAPDGSHSRVHRQCHLCGNSRDEDGTSPVRWMNPTQSVAAGETRRCRIVGRAPSDRYVHLHLASVLETWEQSARVVGSQHHEIFEPGSPIDVTLTIDVPAGLVPGVYPVGVLGVLNGSMISMRCSLPFAAPR